MARSLRRQTDMATQLQPRSIRKQVSNQHAPVQLPAARDGLTSGEAMRGSPIVIEDQLSPNRCGHVAGKDVVNVEIMKRRKRQNAARRFELSSEELS